MRPRVAVNSVKNVIVRDFIFNLFNKKNFLEAAIVIVRDFIHATGYAERTESIKMQEGLLIEPMSQLIKNHIKNMPFKDVSDLSDLSRKLCQLFLNPSDNRILCHNLFRLWWLHSKDLPNKNKIVFKLTDNEAKDPSKIDKVMLERVKVVQMHFYKEALRSASICPSIAGILLFGAGVDLAYIAVLIVLYVVVYCHSGKGLKTANEMISAKREETFLMSELSDCLLTEVLLKSVKLTIVQHMEPKQQSKPVSNKKSHSPQVFSQEPVIYSDNSSTMGVIKKIRAQKKEVTKKITSICNSTKNLSEDNRPIRWVDNKNLHYVYKPFKARSSISRVWSNDASITKENCRHFLFCNTKILAKTKLDEMVRQELESVISEGHQVFHENKRGIIDIRKSKEAQDGESFKAKTLKHGCAHVRAFFRPIAIQKFEDSETVNVLHGISRITNN